MRCASCTSLVRATPSRRLSVGYAIAFSSPWCQQSLDRNRPSWPPSSAPQRRSSSPASSRRRLRLGLPKANQIGRIARQARLEALLAAEEVEVDVLRPVLADRFVAFVVRVLRVEQTDHQPNWQPWPARCARPSCCAHRRHAEQIDVLPDPAFANTPLEHRCQRRFDRRPRHAHGQRVTKIDHGIQTAAEKIGVLISVARKLPESESDQYRFWEFAESRSITEGSLCVPARPSAALTK